MRPQGKRHRTIPVPINKGMFSAGDPSTLADGFVRSLRNYVIRPDASGARLDGRPPFVYDGVDTISGFAVWQDLVNELTKTVAVRSADQKLYTKNTNGQSYGAGVSGLPSSTRLTSWTNFLGKLYMMFDNGSGAPSAAATWDGTNISTSPFNVALYSRAVAAFVDRLFFVNPRMTFTTLGVIGDSYDWTTNYATQLVNVFRSTNASGVAECTVAPTNLYASGNWASVSWIQPHPRVSVAASTSDVLYTWRAEFLGVHDSYRVPFTMAWQVNLDSNVTWPANTAVSVGYIVMAAVSGVLYLFRCTTAGTTGNLAPAWSATVGATVSDNTAVWTNIMGGNTNLGGYLLLGSFEGSVPPTSLSQDYMPYFCTARVPARINTITISPFLFFYNSAGGLTTLAPIKVSRSDGVTDGTPSKDCHGSQWTTGDFYYPFINQESSATATVNIDKVIWSELNNLKSVQAKNTYPLTEIAGLATAAIVANARLVVWKRKGMWIFKGQADFNEPILPEVPAIHVGCLGPQAVANARDGTTYWIGEQHVYKMVIGTDSTPTEIDTPGMYETIMARGSNWVESQSTYNMPLLAIDHANNDVWVYTQKGTIYIYNIRTQAWTSVDTNPTGTSQEVAAMIFDSPSNRMLVSFGGASATRFDETSDAQDTIVTGGGTAWNIYEDIIPKPFELFAPRFEATLLELGLFHLATVQQGTIEIAYSYDRGATWTTPSSYPITTYLANPRIRLPLAATAPSVMVRIRRIGAGGSRNFAVSKLDALMRLHRGEISWVTNT